MGRFTNPRDLYFGEGARHEVKNFKGHKAVIVSGGSSMRRGGFLQDVQADLESAGMEVRLYEGTTGARAAERHSGFRKATSSWKMRSVTGQRSARSGCW